MNRIHTGIEINDNAVKIIESKNAKLKKYIYEDLPANIIENGAVKTPEALSDFLLELKRKYKLKRNLALVIPDDELSIRRITIPAMTDEQIRINIPYEFRDFITGDKNEYIYDYITAELIKNENDDVEAMDILAVAVSKEIMDKYKTIFKNARFNLKYAIPYSLAMGNFVRSISEEDTEDFIIINLGYMKSKIRIYHKNIFDMSRDIDIGFKDLIKVVSDMMSIDIHMAKVYLENNKDNIQEDKYIRELYSELALSALRVINYYTYQNRDIEINKILITGEGDYIKPLMNLLKNELPFEIISADKYADDSDMKKIFIEAPAAYGILQNI